MPSLDVFNQDAFSTLSLTDAVNKIPFIPGLTGQLGLFTESGVPTTTVLIDEKDGLVALVPTSPRGAPATQNKHTKRKARSLVIPHLALEDAIQADEVEGVRAFGSETELQTVQGITNERFAEMTGKVDATLEHLRIGAVKGQVLDSDGSTIILDLFTAFGVSQIAEKDFALDAGSPAPGAVRKICHGILRNMRTELGAVPFTGIWAFCGSAFFDDLVSHSEVTSAYERWAGNPISSGATIAARTGQPGDFLRAGLVEQTVEYAGIVFQEYRGTVGGVDFVDTDKCHIFPVGVPRLFRTIFAPADFVETVNTVGLPRYGKQAMDARFQRFVELHLQSNPLNYCTRPRVLIQGKRT